MFDKYPCVNCCFANFYPFQNVRTSLAVIEILVLDNLSSMCSDAKLFESYGINKKSDDATCQQCLHYQQHMHLL